MFNASIRQTLTIVHRVYWPRFTYNISAQELYCIDNTTQRQVCSVLSVKVIGVGRNVDGFYKDYLNGQMNVWYVYGVDSMYPSFGYLNIGFTTNTSN